METNVVFFKIQDLVLKKNLYKIKPNGNLG